MNITRFLPFLLIFGIIAISGCKKDPEPEPSEEDQRLEALADTWKLGSGTVTLDGNDRTADWAGFEITFTTAKGYSTTASFDDNVWPSAGTWNFQGISGSGLDVIIRNDGIAVNISTPTTTLTLSFDYLITRPLKNGRVESIEGNWIFSLSK